MSSRALANPILGWLAGCYFFFFAILGGLLPYLAVFLKNRGFDKAEIGSLLAIFMGTRIVAPNLWGILADKKGMRGELVKFGAFAAAMSYISFFYQGNFWYLAVSLTVYTFFWNSILAQLEVITLETLGSESNRYGAIRSFGSLGYIVFVILTGAAIKYFGSEVLLIIGLTLFFGLLLCALPLPSKRVAIIEKQHQTPIKLTYAVTIFLLSAIFLQASVGPFYAFFVLYLKEIGYSEIVAGIFISLGAIAEIGMFILAPNLLRRFSLKGLLLVGLSMTILRWLLLAFYADNVIILTVSQLLHAFTFGLVHAASIQFVFENFEKQHRAKGQAIYASLSFGLGGALGIWISGLIWDNGSAVGIWLFATSCAVISFLIALLIPINNTKMVADHV